MTPTYVLDTSALLAHFLGEPGWETVERLLEKEADTVFINAVAWLEFQVRLKEVAPDKTKRERALQIYVELLAGALPVTRETAAAAFELRQAAASRLPNSDALIAATARLKGATLVHRDPHLAAIPSRLLRQQMLPEKSSPAKSA
jgi:predicted nucleic acid-binding protein